MSDWRDFPRETFFSVSGKVGVRDGIPEVSTLQKSHERTAEFLLSSSDVFYLKADI